MNARAKQYSYYITTFGCQMNKNDSERLASVLSGMGLSPANAPDDADVILLNSCSVRESAENRIFGYVKNFAALKRRNPELIIAVTGCMPGRDKHHTMRKKMPEADLYFPTKEMIFLPERLASLNPNLRPMTDMPADYLSLRPALNRTFQSFVTIQTGCNHFCTYCVVPYARGLENNRPVRDILAEVRGLAARGCVEVTLLGQIVNHYIAPDPDAFAPDNPYRNNDFAKLLWEINAIPGIRRIHWTAPHPLYMDDEAIDALTLPHQVNYLHLPMQSGNDAVLARMNRRHTADFYRGIIRKIRAKKPDIAIGTDIIVGFSGETDEQFDDTMRLYRDCDFDISYHARYSERSGTLAAGLYPDTVGIEEKKRRWQAVQDVMEERTFVKNQAFTGKRVSILVDAYENGWCIGNTNEMKRARFKGEQSLVGRIVPTEVFRAETWMLWSSAL
ncbi:MAG: tRNA (N6-isopentenyl adenosine(37)-C2)-methylthiotransferase MiaB [Candidatus Paceibacterota bacterium]|jgi:tRNA-2-methylthio-N6-dimethylallyladenosine synthase